LTETLGEAVIVALDRVIDPCSVGRGIPAGLEAMGMVKRVDVDGAKRSVSVTLQLTSPGCHFQIWFFERVREEVLSIPGVEECSVSFSKDFDWSDDSMSPALRERLSQRRHQLGLTTVRSQVDL
jgi:metal-sulfur cluster biosynthetic enzyme